MAFDDQPQVVLAVCAFESLVFADCARRVKLEERLVERAATVRRRLRDGVFDGLDLARLYEVSHARSIEQYFECGDASARRRRDEALRHDGTQVER